MLVLLFISAIALSQGGPQDSVYMGSTPRHQRFHFMGVCSLRKIIFLCLCKHCKLRDLTANELPLQPLGDEQLRYRTANREDGTCCNVVAKKRGHDLVFTLAGDELSSFGKQAFILPGQIAMWQHPVSHDTNSSTQYHHPRAGIDNINTWYSVSPSTIPQELHNTLNKTNLSVKIEH